MKSISSQSLFKQFIEQGFVVALFSLLAVVFMAGSYYDDKGIEGSDDFGMNKYESGGKFNYSMTKDGVIAKFLIINLENMNMKDPSGATHHVMVRFFNANTGTQLEKVSGDIEFVSPSKEIFVASIRDYKGVYAANISFIQLGKYKIVCHAKIDKKNPLYQFWYNYHQ